MKRIFFMILPLGLEPTFHLNNASRVRSETVVKTISDAQRQFWFDGERPYNKKKKPPGWAASSFFISRFQTVEDLSREFRLAQCAFIVPGAWHCTQRSLLRSNANINSCSDECGVWQLVQISGWPLRGSVYLPPNGWACVSAAS